MIDTIFEKVSDIISEVFDWVSALNTNTHFLDIAIGVFVIFSVIRFFILPLLKGGVGKSDSVKKKRGVDNE